jgi:uncharacterized membrane protein
MYSWASAAPAISAAFLASLVEVVEALTIVLAVSTVAGLRPAALGTAAALLVLAGLVLLLGPMLTLIPLHALQFFIGVLLLLFGMKWLRKAILRAAGFVPLHDENLAFEEERFLLEGKVRAITRRQWLAGITAFKAVFLEGLEVVFIVIAVGAGTGALFPASLGAAIACIAVLLVGIMIHRPLARVPENWLKFGVGVMLSAFGLFWTGEGLGVFWFLGDLTIVLFGAGFLAIGLALVQAMRIRVGTVQ